MFKYWLCLKKWKFVFEWKTTGTNNNFYDFP